MIFKKEEALMRARKAVMRRSGGQEERKWLVGKAPDCYNNPNYRTQIHVLEGSPARGFILDSGGPHSGILVVIDMNGEFIKRLEYLD